MKIDKNCTKYLIKIPIKFCSRTNVKINESNTFNAHKSNNMDNLYDQNKGKLKNL